MVKGILSNPSETGYLYIGKYDPESDEVFLLADKSLQVAKDGSIGAGESGGVGAADSFNPMGASADEFAGRMSRGGQTPVRGVEDMGDINENFKQIIKRLVNEIIDESREGGGPYGNRADMDATLQAAVRWKNSGITGEEQRNAEEVAHKAYPDASKVVYNPKNYNHHRNAEFYKWWDVFDSEDLIGNVLEYYEGKFWMVTKTPGVFNTAYNPYETRVTY
jgi:hypothetical protein